MCSRPFRPLGFAHLCRSHPRGSILAATHRGLCRLARKLHSLDRAVSYVADPISSVETQSLPSLLHCYPRSFTFYLGNPFPRLQGDDVATSWRVIEGFSVGLVIPDL